MNLQLPIFIPDLNVNRYQKLYAEIECLKSEINNIESKFNMIDNACSNGSLFLDENNYQNLENLYAKIRVIVGKIHHFSTIDNGTALLKNNIYDDYIYSLIHGGHVIVQKINHILSQLNSEIVKTSTDNLDMLYAAIVIHKFSYSTELPKEFVNFMNWILYPTYQTYVPIPTSGVSYNDNNKLDSFEIKLFHALSAKIYHSLNKIFPIEIVKHVNNIECMKTKKLLQCANYPNICCRDIIVNDFTISMGYMYDNRIEKIWNGIHDFLIIIFSLYLASKAKWRLGILLDVLPKQLKLRKIEEISFEIGNIIIEDPRIEFVDTHRHQMY